MPEHHWTFLHRRRVFEHFIFDLHQDRYRVEPAGEESDFLVLQASDWVNVIPVTADGQVVLIRQYRHGIRQVTLEVPGGMIEPGEDPQHAALRELSEETGYTTEKIKPLGFLYPNPAIQDNKCFSFLAENVQPTGIQQPDQFERIEVVTHPLSEIPKLILSGAIGHSLVVNAFALMGWAAR
jgi:8-oxo-dGTP pyrophosphatase MutT (NUDIX family)